MSVENNSPQPIWMDFLSILLISQCCLWIWAPLGECLFKSPAVLVFVLSALERIFKYLNTFPVLWLVNIDNVTWLFAFDWSMLITWPEYLPLIGQCWHISLVSWRLQMSTPYMDRGRPEARHLLVTLTLTDILWWWISLDLRFQSHNNTHGIW